MNIIYLENDLSISNFFLKLFETHNFTFHYINQLHNFEKYLALHSSTLENCLIITNAQIETKDMCSYTLYARRKFKLQLPAIIYSVDNIIDNSIRARQAGIEHFFPLPVLPYDIVNCIYDIKNSWALANSLKKNDIQTDNAIASIDSNNTLKSKGISHLFTEYLDNYFATHLDFDPASGLLMRILNEIEPAIILSSLKYTQGNRIKAADILGINRNTLRKKMIAYNIDTLELLDDAS